MEVRERHLEDWGVPGEWASDSRPGAHSQTLQKAARWARSPASAFADLQNSVPKKPALDQSTEAWDQQGSGQEQTIHRQGGGEGCRTDPADVTPLPELATDQDQQSGC